MEVETDTGMRFSCGCRVRPSGAIYCCKKHRQHFDIFHNYKFREHRPCLDRAKRKPK